MLILCVVYAIVLLALTWRNFRIGLALLVIFLPTYIIRFQLGSIPSTFLELTFLVVWGVWMVRYAREDYLHIKKIVQRQPIFFLCASVFFVASVASIFVGETWFKSLGLWRAYFLEPMALFFMMLGRLDESATEKQSISRLTIGDVVWFLTLSTLSISVYAIIQKYTGWGILVSEWAAPSTRRVTSFFTSPNAVGLYLGPAVVMMGAYLAQKKEDGPAFFKKKMIALCAFVLALCALVFTKSEGTMMGLLAALLVVVYLLGYKKMAIGAILVGMVLMITVPKVRSNLLLQGRSGQNRLKLWSYSWDFLSASPQHFVLGSGLRQFYPRIQQPRFNPKELEPLIYPHNIAFNFWTEIGLFGMLAFFGMLWTMGRMAFPLKNSSKYYWAVGFCALLVLTVVHGFVDVPYFKNDLAMEWWLLASLYLTKDLS